ncbi:MAG TPA: FAD:protein FMN transferase [Candidatus Nanoarchaeia archaeon]|nr:FAD:protein FMN transferase [Candidatus Nanoarchaeia archaeon]
MNVTSECAFKGKLFGREIEIVIYGVNEKKSAKIFEEVYKEALRLEKIFNFYDNNSELSKLNKKRKMNISQELAEVLTKSLVFCEMTDGEYDVSLGKSIKNRKEGKNDIEVSCSYKDIGIDGRKVSLNHEDVLIDLSSIAKGYITDRLGDFLKANGAENFIIDSRGDILVSGNIKQIISIQHPRDKDRDIGKIIVEDEAVATSGDYNQFYGSYDKPHILNKKDVISATVVAPSLEEADVYASALFLTDEKSRKKLSKENPYIKAIIVNNKLEKEYLGEVHEA